MQGKARKKSTNGSEWSSEKIRGRVAKITILMSLNARFDQNSIPYKIDSQSRWRMLRSSLLSAIITSARGTLNEVCRQLPHFIVSFRG